MKKKLSLLLFMILFLAGIVINPSHVYAADGGQNLAAAVSINVNSSYNDNLSSSSDVDYYKFTLKKSGCVNIDFKHTNLLKSGYYYYITIYNDQTKILLSASSTGVDENTKTCSLGLDAGTYYVRFAKGNYYSNTTYTFKVNYKEAANWEKEKNDTMADATPIKTNYTFHGAIQYSNDLDYYSFTLPTDGYVVVYFDHEAILSSGSYWYYYIYNSETKLIMSDTAYGNSESSNSTYIGLAAGTYYFKVNKAVSYSNMDYSFSISYTGCDFFEKELNESLDTANEIPVNNMQAGSLRFSSDLDYYTFTIPEDGFVNMDFYHGEILSSSSYWCMTLYDSDTYALMYASFYGTEPQTSTLNIGLAAGTYYLRIYKGNSYKNDPYTFRINYTESDYWEKEPNEKIDAANEITLNNLYSASLKSSNDIDFFKFTLPYKVKLNLTLSHEMMTQSGSFYYLALMNNAGSTLYSFSSSGTEAETLYSTPTLDAGTYYIKVNKGNNYSSGDYGIKLTCGHSYKVTKAATLTENGYKNCRACGKKVTIYHPDSFTLSKTSYVYDGNVKTPSLTILNTKGSTISDSYYTVEKDSGRKYVGRYYYTITFKGSYSGSKTVSFKIVPKSTAISAVTALTGGFKVTWNKQATQTTGYQLSYATNSSFIGAKTYTSTKNTTLSKSVTGLSSGKKYYVKVRTYKTVDGTRYYSSWSSYKTLTTK